MVLLGKWVEDVISWDMTTKTSGNYWQTHGNYLFFFHGQVCHVFFQLFTVLKFISKSLP